MNIIVTQTPYRNSIPAYLVMSDSLSQFKNQLDSHWTHIMYLIPYTDNQIPLSWTELDTKGHMASQNCIHFKQAHQICFLHSIELRSIQNVLKNTFWEGGIFPLAEGIFQRQQAKRTGCRSVVQHKALLSGPLGPATQSFRLHL